MIFQVFPFITKRGQALDFELLVIIVFKIRNTAFIYGRDFKVLFKMYFTKTINFVLKYEVNESSDDIQIWDKPYTWRQFGVVQI